MATSVGSLYVNLVANTAKFNTAIGAPVFRSAGALVRGFQETAVSTRSTGAGQKKYLFREVRLEMAS